MKGKITCAFTLISNDLVGQARGLKPLRIHMALDQGGLRAPWFCVKHFHGGYAFSVIRT